MIVYFIINPVYSYVQKIANIKTIETESKLGAKPLLSNKKRKLGASQTQLARKLQKTNASSSIIQSKQVCSLRPYCMIDVIVFHYLANRPLKLFISESSFQHNLDTLITIRLINNLIYMFIYFL